MAGVDLIAIGLYEVFHTLLHPTGRGRVTAFVSNATWRASSRLGRRGRTVAGPLAAVAVIMLWAGFQVIGWALVYLPHVPDAFAYNPEIRPEAYPAIVEAFYYSVVSMSTLGLGDVYPVEPWLRVVAPIQGLIGFALLTAAVAWFVELYPGLGRRRALALRIALMERSDTASHLPDREPATASALLDSITADLAQVRIDVWQNAESYYFTEDQPEASLAAQLPYALHLARLARRSPAGPSAAAATCSRRASTTSPASCEAGSSAARTTPTRRSASSPASIGSRLWRPVSRPTARWTEPAPDGPARGWCVRLLLGLA